MKTFIAFLLSFAFFSTSVFAEDISLYVFNRTAKRVTLEKSNGKRMTISPMTYIILVDFPLDSHVDAYVDNAFVCGWDIKKELIGISYQNDRTGSGKCVNLYG